MKDITKTSFGLIIAYVLPGTAALFCIYIWSETTSNLLTCYFSTDISFSFFLSIMCVATILGLIVNSFRFIIFEIFIFWKKRLTSKLFQKMGTSDKLEMFQIILDENFRYHQFYGCISILFPIIVFGVIFRSKPFHVCNIWLLVIVSVIIETVIVLNAYVAFIRYYERRSAILKEGNDA